MSNPRRGRRISDQEADELLRSLSQDRLRSLRSGSQMSERPSRGMVRKPGRRGQALARPTASRRRGRTHGGGGGAGGGRRATQSQSNASRRQTQRPTAREGTAVASSESLSGEGMQFRLTSPPMYTIKDGRQLVWVPAHPHTMKAALSYGWPDERESVWIDVEDVGHRIRSPPPPPFRSPRTLPVFSVEEEDEDGDPVIVVARHTERDPEFQYLNDDGTARIPTKETMWVAPEWPWYPPKYANVDNPDDETSIESEPPAPPTPDIMSLPPRQTSPEDTAMTDAVIPESDLNESDDESSEDSDTPAPPTPDIMSLPPAQTGPVDTAMSDGPAPATATATAPAIVPAASQQPVAPTPATRSSAFQEFTTLGSPIESSASSPPALSPRRADASDLAASEQVFPPFEFPSSHPPLPDAFEAFPFGTANIFVNTGANLDETYQATPVGISTQHALATELVQGPPNSSAPLSQPANSQPTTQQPAYRHSSNEIVAAQGLTELHQRPPTASATSSRTRRSQATAQQPARPTSPDDPMDID